MYLNKVIGNLALNGMGDSDGPDCFAISRHHHVLEGYMLKASDPGKLRAIIHSHMN